MNILPLFQSTEAVSRRAWNPLRYVVHGMWIPIIIHPKAYFFIVAVFSTR